MIDIENLQTYDDIVLDTGIYIEYFMLKENKIKKMLREQLFSEDSEMRTQQLEEISLKIKELQAQK